MRLGKEQWSGYVEDTDADADTTLGEELTVSQPEQTELTPQPLPTVTVG